jgi:hypothetical protein
MAQELDPTSDAARTGEDADENRETLAQNADANLHRADYCGAETQRSLSDVNDFTDVREFSRSSNGDTWSVGADRQGSMMVLHRGNLPSGGHETVTPVNAFLNTGPKGPQHEALVAMLADAEDRGAVETNQVKRTGVLRSLLTELGLSSPERAGEDRLRDNQK